MTESTESTDDPRARLRDLDEQIARLRGDTAALGDQTGGQGYGTLDENDTAAALTNFEESQALLAALEQRRATLVERLGGEGT